MTPDSPDNLAAQVQSTLGDSHVIERELGGGGMSRVFLATERAFERKVVIKVLPTEAAAAVSIDRFKREISLAARLQQANIVPVLTAGEMGGVPYFTMPFVEGQSLRAHLAGTKGLPIKETIGILKEVARALAYAHSQGVVHRDIKPDNVLLSGGTAMVTDFGVAKALSAAANAQSAALTGTGLAIGTPAYMSPEQATADPATDHRTDIYAFGCLAYELLTGAPPFAGRGGIPQIVAAHITEDPEPVTQHRAAVPPAVATLVAQCLAKNPADRPQSANEIVARLDDAQLTSSAPQATTVLIAAAPKSSRRFMMMAAGLALIGAAIGGWMLLRPARGFASVAVLPFENIGGDTANLYFADGMADELTTALSKMPGLRVPSRSSAFRFRGPGVDVKAAGTALGVASVLEGTVRRAGGKLRITATLTNARDGSVVWSSQFEREVSDVFLVEEELARAILSNLRPALSGTVGTSAAATVAQAVAKGTANAEAYDLFLRGNHLLNQRGPGVTQSIPFFEQAIAKDSGFARAYAALGAAHAFVSVFSYGPPNPLNDIDRGLALSMRAVAMDSMSAEAHGALGFALGAAGRINEALAEMQRSAALDPTSDLPLRGISSLYSSLGRIDEAVESGRHATELDPLSATSINVYSRTLLIAGKPEEARRMAQHAVELDSLSPLGPPWLAVIEYFAGNKSKAHDLAAVATLAPAGTGGVAFVLAATGDTARASAIERKLLAGRENDAYTDESLAALYLGRGDTTRALAALERSNARHEPFTYSLTPGHPIFDSIRHSARFAAILKARGLDVAALTRSRAQ